MSETVVAVQAKATTLVERVDVRGHQEAQIFDCSDMDDDLSAPVTSVVAPTLKAHLAAKQMDSSKCVLELTRPTQLAVLLYGEPFSICPVCRPQAVSRLPLHGGPPQAAALPVRVRQRTCGRPQGAMPHANHAPSRPPQPAITHPSGWRPCFQAQQPKNVLTLPLGNRIIRPVHRTLFGLPFVLQVIVP
jgi:hypothetical protein